MKSMKRSHFRNGNFSYNVLVVCHKRETQSVLTLSGLNPANFEIFDRWSKTRKTVHTKKCQWHGNMCN